MKRLDRYVLTEVIPPFLFGIGAFMVVIVGVEFLYRALRMLYQDGFPLWAVTQIFLLQLPGVITLTLPMAVMFGSLMAIGRISSDGELVAMRAGGASIPRVGLPIILFGLFVTLSGFAISETLVPWCRHRAWQIARQMHGTVAEERDFALEVRGENEGLERWLHARDLDTDSLRMVDVTIVDFTIAARPYLYTAQSARWQGEHWVLENVEVTYWQGGQRIIEGSIPRMKRYVGRSAAEIEHVRKMPEDMTLRELQEQAALSEERGRTTWANRLRQHYHVRIALPWATVGLAVLGVGMGVQRQRSSRGIGLGLSLVVIFIYYIVTHTLSLLGERGVAHPALTAWVPNILLYLTALGFMLRTSR